MDTNKSSLRIARRVQLIAGISLSLGLLFDFFFYPKLPGINFFLFTSLILAGIIFVALKTKSLLSRESGWLMLPVLFFSSMVFVRASGFLTFLNIVATLSLLLLIAEVGIRRKLSDFTGRDYFATFLVPFKSVGSLVENIPKVFSHPVFRSSKASNQVIRGLIIALPFLFIFGLLFYSADLVLQRYLSGIHFNISPNLVWRLIMITFVATGLFGAYTYLFGGESTEAKPRKETKRLGHVETSVVLGAINALFFVFILIQLAYLFGGESNIISQGLTYAEYARKGFFELIAVAIISLLLILGLEKQTAKKNEVHTQAFKILSTILIAQVLIIMVSSFMRLMLYEEAYGFTTLRLYSHAFIVLLAVNFAFLLYKIYKNSSDAFFAKQAFISLILFLVAMNLLNPDAFIARQNLARFRSTGKLDTQYLINLSADAVPEKVKILTMPGTEKLRQDVGTSLQNINKHRPDQYKHWLSANLSRQRAYKISADLPK